MNCKIYNLCFTNSFFTANNLKTYYISVRLVQKGATLVQCWCTGGNESLPSSSVISCCLHLLYGVEIKSSALPDIFSS